MIRCKRISPARLTGLIFLNLVISTSIAQNSNTHNSLKDAFREDFVVGTSMNSFQIMGRDTRSVKLIENQYNTITGENCMKWERIHPKPGTYNFRLADGLVEFGEKHDMYLVGHTLVWHRQTPQWVFQDSEGNLTTRDTLLMRMRDHIHTVVGRYKGRVHSWDVVNEVVGADGEIRKSLWYQIIGEDFIEKAFTFAREADPDAVLIYNDYSWSSLVKRNGAVRMVKDLQSKGVPIDGIGMQAHYHLGTPSLKDIKASIQAYSDLGIRVMVTEMEITVLPVPGSNRGADINQRFENENWLNPYTEGLPDSVQTVLTNRYREIFNVFKTNNEHIDRITFWGVHDGVSWKNNWPVRGRTNHPLLFDREVKPKPSYDAVLEVALSN